MRVVKWLYRIIFSGGVVLILDGRHSWIGIGVALVGLFFGAVYVEMTRPGCQPEV